MTVKVLPVAVKVDRQHAFLFADVRGIFEEHARRGEALRICDLNILVPVMSADEGSDSVQFSVLKGLDIQEFERCTFFVLDIIDIDFLIGGMLHVSVPLVVSFTTPNL